MSAPALAWPELPAPSPQRPWAAIPRTAITHLPRRVSLLAFACVMVVGERITNLDDQEISWNPKNETDIAHARRLFFELTGKGYTAFRSAYREERVSKWDPSLGRLFLTAPRNMMTGAEQEKVKVAIDVEHFCSALNKTKRAIYDGLKEAFSRGMLGVYVDPETKQRFYWQRPENFGGGPLLPAGTKPHRPKPVASEPPPLTSASLYAGDRRAAFAQPISQAQSISETEAVKYISQGQTEGEAEKYISQGERPGQDPLTGTPGEPEKYISHEATGEQERTPGEAGKYIAPEKSVSSASGAQTVSPENQASQGRAIESTARATECTGDPWTCPHLLFLRPERDEEGRKLASETQSSSLPSEAEVQELDHGVAELALLQVATGGNIYRDIGRPNRWTLRNLIREARKPVLPGPADIKKFLASKIGERWDNWGGAIHTLREEFQPWWCAEQLRQQQAGRQYAANSASLPDVEGLPEWPEPDSAGENPWSAIQGVLAAEMTPQAFQNWFARPSFAGLEAGELRLFVPDRITKAALEQEYAQAIVKAAAGLGFDIRRIICGRHQPQKT